MIAFPKTQKGTDLMTDAPGEADAKQLDELHIASTWKPDSIGDTHWSSVPKSRLRRGAKLRA